MSVEERYRVGASDAIGHSGLVLDSWDSATGLAPARVQRRRGWLVRRLLVVADVLALVTAFSLLLLLTESSSGALDSRAEAILFLLSLPFWVVGAKLYRLYDRDEERADHSTVDEVVAVFHLVTVGVFLFFVVSWASEVTAIDGTRLATFWLLAIPSIVLFRSAARTLGRRHPAYRQRTIVVGAGDVGQLIGRKLLHHPEYGIDLVGFVDGQPRERHGELCDAPLLGAHNQLAHIIESHDVERVIFAFSNESHADVLGLIRDLKEFDVQIDIVPRLFEIVGASTTMHSIEGIPVVSVPPLRLSRSSLLLKRAIDLLFATTAVVVLAPALTLAAVAIKLTSPGPVFFRQTRMGYGNRTFTIFKFRTMRVDADAIKWRFASLNKHVADDPRMFKIPDDPRVTSVGRLLRRYSLDELPQLFNVLRGEMSLVGPRPLILEEDQYVGAWARRRLDIRPGMTGLWQVLGRNEIPFEEMVKLDYLYVTGWSLGGDLKLMAKTIPAIFRARHVY